MWNHGEGFWRTARKGVVPPPSAPADTGGFHWFDDGRDVQLSDIHPNPQADGGWSAYGYTDPGGGPGNRALYRFRGFLHPDQNFSGDGFDARCAFEVFIPQTFEGQGAVLVIAVFHTFSGGEDGYSGHSEGKFTDPANAGLHGTLGQGPNGAPPYADVLRPAPLDRLAAFSGQAKADGHDIIAAHIMPTISGGPMLLAAQRVLQLEKAIRLMLAQKDILGLPIQVPQGYPVCVIGGSNGGHSAQFLATMFPDIVHGAVSSQFSPQLRNVVGQNEVCTMLTLLQGFSGTSQGWGRTYSLEYTVPYAMLGFSKLWATGSTLSLFQTGFLKRPIFFVASDEDMVWNGTEEISLLNGGTWAPTGATATDPAIYWTVPDKHTHIDRGTYHIPEALAPPGHPMSLPQSELALAVLPFLKKVVASAGTQQVAPTENDVESYLANAGESPIAHEDSYDPRLDSYGPVLARESTHDRRTGLGPNAISLTEDESFWARQRGLGTGLGQGESLAVDGAGRIYVGSADGIVTRVVLNDPADLEFDSDLGETALRIDTRCKPAAGATTYSLGYGATGVAVDDEWLVVATHRRLYAYDLVLHSDLGEPRYTVDLPWAEQRPIRIALFQGLFGGEERYVAYVSYSGEFVVRAIDGLFRVAQFSDPGLIDFEVGDDQDFPVSGWSRSLYLATRERVVQAVVDGSLDYPAGIPSNVRILAASEVLGSGGWLLWNDGGAGRVLAGLIGGAVREFDLSTPPKFQVISLISLPDDDPAARGLYSPEPAFSSSLASLGGGAYVALRQGEMFVVQNDIGYWADLEPGEMNTVLFPAAYYPTALAAGDIDGDGLPDAVIATESGQVAWIPHASLLNGDMSAIESAVLGYEWYGTGYGAQPAAYSSGSVAATWGMCWGPSKTCPGEEWIQVVDQCARRWEINPRLSPPPCDKPAGWTGFRNLVRDVDFWAYSSPLLQDPPQAPVVIPRVATKPFRDLVWVGSGPPSSISWPDVFDDISPPGLSGQSWLMTCPFFTWMGAGRVLPPDANGTGPLVAIPVRVDHYQLYDDGYLPLCFGGDLIEPSTVTGQKEIYFWTGTHWNHPNFIESHDSVRGIIHAPITSPDTPGYVSSATKSDGQTPPYQTHLRNTTMETAPHDAQSLRAGEWPAVPPLSGVRLVASTVGGSVIVLNPRPQNGFNWITPFGEGPDKGFGGLALCVAKVHDGAVAPTIFQGTLYAHRRERTELTGFGGLEMVSSLHVYDYSESGLVETDAFSFDGSEGRPLLFGVCGLAVADIVAEPADSVDDELVVTTLNGDFVLFDLEDPGDSPAHVIVGELLYHEVYDGALGANNAILADVLADPKALYVAGSAGMRKFTVDAPPPP